MKNQALVMIYEEQLAKLLRLPEGQRVIAVSSDFTRSSVVLLIEGDGLDPVPEGEQRPRIIAGDQLDLELRAKVEHLADHWDSERYPMAHDVIEWINATLSGEIDPRISMGSPLT